MQNSSDVVSVSEHTYSNRIQTVLKAQSAVSRVERRHFTINKRLLRRNANSDNVSDAVMAH